MSYPTLLPTIGNRLAEEIDDELYKARSKNRPFNSSHEGYAVILEELDELWEEVRKKRSERDLEHMKRECIQIAAMSIRFIQDLIEEKGEKRDEPETT